VFSAPALPAGHRKLQQTTGPLWSVTNGTALGMANTVFSGFTGRTIFSIAGLNSQYRLTNVTISNNVGATAGSRAPIEVLNSGSVSLTNCRISNNIYSDANGVFAISANRMDVVGTTFSDNNRQDGPTGEVHLGEHTDDIIPLIKN
jgi:hypothetical protein